MNLRENLMTAVGFGIISKEEGLTILFEARKGLEMDRKRYYKLNKRLFVRLLAGVSLPACLTAEQRIIQRDYGVMPEGWECHHVLSRSNGGADEINNFCLIKHDDHVKLHQELDGQNMVELTEEHRPVLVKLAKKHNGVFLEYN